MLKLDHVVIPVRDVAACLDFYRELLGLALVDTASGDDWGGYPWLMLMLAARDGRMLVLTHFPGAPKPRADGLAADARHIAFAESSARAFAGWRRKLDAHGVEYWEEDHGTQRSLYFADPDGLVIEITAPPTRAPAVGKRSALAAARRWIATHVT